MLRKKVKFLLSFLALPLLVLSCERGESVTNEKSKELTVTGAVTDVTEWSARLSGYANLTPDLGNVTLGIIYSTEDSPSLENSLLLFSRELDSNNMYTVEASELSSGTTYYYKSFVRYSGVYRFGEVKQFTTLDIKATFDAISATDVTRYSATLNGSLTLASNENLPIMDVRFYYSDSIKEATELVERGTRSNGSLVSYASFQSSISDLSSSTMYYYVPAAKIYDKEIYGDVQSFQTQSLPANLPEGTVDLGLSVFWASCNLGASSPEENGDYYAWGEIIPYYTEGHSQDNPCGSWRDRADHPITGYNWASYKWCNGDYNKLTRYCPSDKVSYWDGEGDPDNKTEFKDYDYADDAARAKLGGDWRMPTIDEFQELINNCESAWVILNGVYGRKFTSRKTNKWIFLPAAGNRGNDKLGNVWSYGWFWSSSLNANGPDYAWTMRFASSDVSVSTGCSNRYYGKSVRPVVTLYE